jgi:hypothetical protein
MFVLWMHPFGIPAGKITTLRKIFPNIDLSFQNMPKQPSEIAMVLFTSLVTCKILQVPKMAPYLCYKV